MISHMRYYHFIESTHTNERVNIMTKQEIEIAKSIQLISDKCGITYQEAANQFEMLMEDFLEVLNDKS